MRLLDSCALPLTGIFLVCNLNHQVIVLSRHGVRGPYGLGEETPSEETLKKYVRNPNVKLPLSANAWGTSEDDDPTEVVSPKLTKHGFNMIKLMGEVRMSHHDVCVMRRYGTNGS